MIITPGLWQTCSDDDGHSFAGTIGYTLLGESIPPKCPLGMRSCNCATWISPRRSVFKIESPHNNYDSLSRHFFPCMCPIHRVYWTQIQLIYVPDLSITMSCRRVESMSSSCAGVWSYFGQCHASSIVVGAIMRLVYGLIPLSVAVEHGRSSW